jgi:hypothetical protein
MADPELTLEAREAIRSFLIKWFTLPGTIGAIVVFLLGFYIKDVAQQKATNDAFSLWQATMMKLTDEVKESKSKADTASREIDVMMKQIQETGKRANEFSQTISGLDQKLQTTKAFQDSDTNVQKIADIIAQDPRIRDKILDIGKNVNDRIALMESGIAVMRDNMKIRCLQGKIKELGKNLVFQFEFPVKNAWLEESQQRIPVALFVKSIDGSRVTVSSRSSRLEGVADSNDYLYLSLRGIECRVCGTAF